MPETDGYWWRCRYCGAVHEREEIMIEHEMRCPADNRITLNHPDPVVVDKLNEILDRLDKIEAKVESLIDAMEFMEEG